MVALIAPPELELPPGDLPLDVVRGEVRRYRAGTISVERLIGSVDRHGQAVEHAIAAKLQHDLSATFSASNSSPRGSRSGRRRRPGSRRSRTGRKPVRMR
jgi:hypothetical protein